MEIKGAILDVDGTLVDSNDAHTKAWIKALKDAGYEVTYEQIKRLIGMGSDNLLPEVAGLEKESEKGKKISEAWSEIFEKEYLPHVSAFPRTREMLQALKKHGLKLVVASSAEEGMLGKLLEIAGAKDLIEAQTSSDDAKNSKPDPDIVQAALKQIGLRPDEVLMLGDTPYDIEAARKAGVGTIAFRCGGWDDEGLRGAVAVYDGPADLLKNLEQSPLLAG